MSVASVGKAQASSPQDHVFVFALNRAPGVSDISYSNRKRIGIRIMAGTGSRGRRAKQAFFKAQKSGAMDHNGFLWYTPRPVMESRSPGEVTVLLQQIGAGDSRAADKLIPLVLEELHRLALAHLRKERPGHTLQPTALVNEAYLRLVGDQARHWHNRAHFIGVSASLMRRILIDYARRKQALKRDAGEHRVPYAEDYTGLSYEQAHELIALDIALDRLEQMNLRQRQVVELRYFGGLSIEETAEALGISPVTVKRDWVAARAWLKGQVRPETFHEIRERAHGAGTVG